MYMLYSPKQTRFFNQITRKMGVPSPTAHFCPRDPEVVNVGNVGQTKQTICRCDLGHWEIMKHIFTIF